MRILQLKAARGWSGVQAARAFLINEQTLCSWMRRVDADLATIEVTTRVVTAKCPGHVWNVDLTTVPTKAGFWVPWLPYAWPQSWPFCWWVAVVVDHFSRAVVGFAVFVKRPTALEMQRLLDRAISEVGSAPNEEYTGQRPANAALRFEPRTMWPRGSSCAAPQAQIKGRRGAKLILVVGYLEGPRHLPVVELRRAA
jgi:transposase InsO family protein